MNYSVGRAIGPRVFSAGDRSSLFHRLLNREHLKRAHEFFERYGGKAVVLGRFVPIVRTFVPFVAGAAQMTRPTFVFYNVTGALAWVGLCLGAGFLFGNVPIVKENFSLVTIGIVFVSILPMIVEFVRHRKSAEVKVQKFKVSRKYVLRPVGPCNPTSYSLCTLTLTFELSLTHSRYAALPWSTATTTNSGSS